MIAFLHYNLDGTIDMVLISRAPSVEYRGRNQRSTHSAQEAFDEALMNLHAAQSIALR